MPVPPTRGVKVSSRLVIPDEELEWRFTGSGGPGGQHANTANTKVDLRFDVTASKVLSPIDRQRLLARYGREIRIVESSRRSQARNRDEATRRLAQKIREGLVEPRRRRPTRPGRGAVERRLTEKRQRSERKAARRRPRTGPGGADAGAD
jgi:ribosome-associated protein